MIYLTFNISGLPKLPIQTNEYHFYFPFCVNNNFWHHGQHSSIQQLKETQKKHSIKVLVLKKKKKTEH